MKMWGDSVGGGRCEQHIVTRPSGFSTTQIIAEI